MSNIQAIAVLLAIVGTASANSNWSSQQETPKSKHDKLYEQALLLDAQKRYKEEVELLLPAANAGDKDAASAIGALYSDPTSEIKNYELAIKWANKAIDLGAVAGYDTLGLCAEHGFGVPVDEIKAVHYYKLAAEGGDSTGMDSLAGMYERGLGGLPQDNVEAMKLYVKSAQKGSSTGMEGLGRMFYDGKGGLDLDRAAALRLFHKAANLGDADAMAYIGGDFLLQKNYEQALLWVRKGVDKDGIVALVFLASMNEKGLGVPKNHALELQYARRAMALNPVRAKTMLDGYHLAH